MGNIFGNVFNSFNQLPGMSILNGLVCNGTTSHDLFNADNSLDSYSYDAGPEFSDDERLANYSYTTDPREDYYYGDGNASEVDSGLDYSMDSLRRRRRNALRKKLKDAYEAAIAEGTGVKGLTPVTWDEFESYLSSLPNGATFRELDASDLKRLGLTPAILSDLEEGLRSGKPIQFGKQVGEGSGPGLGVVYSNPTDEELDAQLGELEPVADCFKAYGIPYASNEKRICFGDDGSSWIQGVKYNPTTNDLTLLTKAKMSKKSGYNDGNHCMCYVYHNVPEDVFNDFINSDKPGAVFQLRKLREHTDMDKFMATSVDANV